jgi:hypothetical protein
VAFPSNSGTAVDSLDLAWEQARQRASAVRDAATQARAKSLAGTLDGNDVIHLVAKLGVHKTQFNEYASLPGIGAYAQGQLSDPSLNIGAEFTSMMNAIDGVLSWVGTNFPKDANNWLLFIKFDAVNIGQITYRQFSAGETAGLRTALDTLIAAIN